MKNKILAVFTFTCCVISCRTIQCDNGKAVEFFEKDLKALEYLITNLNANQKDMPSIIQRLEEVTSIESESDGNYLGKFHPTKSDLKKWREWFDNNKDKLCWNAKELKCYLHR